MKRVNTSVSHPPSRAVRSGGRIAFGAGVSDGSIPAVPDRPGGGSTRTYVIGAASWVDLTTYNPRRRRVTVLPQANPNVVFRFLVGPADNGSSSPTNNMAYAWQAGSPPLVLEGSIACQVLRTIAASSGGSMTVIEEFY